MTEFKVGDRVKCIALNSRAYNKIGKIICIGSHIGVRYDEDFNGSHNLENRTDGHGWFHDKYSDDLEMFIDEPKGDDIKKDISEFIKALDKNSRKLKKEMGKFDSIISYTTSIDERIGNKYKMMMEQALFQKDERIMQLELKINRNTPMPITDLEFIKRNMHLIKFDDDENIRVYRKAEINILQYTLDNLLVATLPKELQIKMEGYVYARFSEGKAYSYGFVNKDFDTCNSFHIDYDNHICLGDLNEEATRISMDAESIDKMFNKIIKMLEIINLSSSYTPCDEQMKTYKFLDAERKKLAKENGGNNCDCCGHNRDNCECNFCDICDICTVHHEHGDSCRFCDNCGRWFHINDICGNCERCDNCCDCSHDD